MKSNVTKLLALLMAVVLVFSLAACGKESGKETTGAAATEDATQADVSVDDNTTGAVSPTETSTEAITGVTDTSTTGNVTDTTGVTVIPTNKVPSTKAEILAAYTTVMNYAKTAKPAYLKKEFQSLPKADQHMDGVVIGALLPLANSFMTQEKDAKTETQTKGNDMKWFPVCKAPKGCLLTNTGAIKTATCEKLSNGNYKITIILNDEHNPEPYNETTKSASSNTGKMFYPLAKADIDNTLVNDSTVKTVVKNVKYDLKYFNCIATLEYNPKTNHVVNLEQDMSVFIDIQDGKVGIGFLSVTAKGNAILYDKLTAWNFQY